MEAKKSAKNQAKLQRWAHFFFEMGLLKKTKHAGPLLGGVESANLASVAEHTLRAAQIGFVLAKLENYPRPEEVATMLIFHDLEETRIPDIDKLANRYVTCDKEKLFAEQLEELGEVGREIKTLRQRVNYGDPKAEKDTADQGGIIAKDADYLEQAVAAKEFLERGYDTGDFLEHVDQALRTKTARLLLAEIRETRSTDWWKGLKKITTLRKEHL